MVSNLDAKPMVAALRTVFLCADRLWRLKGFYYRSLDVVGSVVGVDAQSNALVGSRH